MTPVGSTLIPAFLDSPKWDRRRIFLVHFQYLTGDEIGVPALGPQRAELAAGSGGAGSAAGGWPQDWEMTQTCFSAGGHPRAGRTLGAGNVACGRRVYDLPVPR